METVILGLLIANLVVGVLAVAYVRGLGSQLVQTRQDVGNFVGTVERKTADIEKALTLDLATKSNEVIRAMSQDVLAASREVMAAKLAANDVMTGRMYAGAAVSAALTKPLNPELSPELRRLKEQDETPPQPEHEFDVMGGPPSGYAERGINSYDDLMGTLPEDE